MTHKQVYEMFQRLHPLYASGNQTWYPNGRNSIRIQVLKEMCFIFTFHNNRKWAFETDESYNKCRIKERR